MKSLVIDQPTNFCDDETGQLSIPSLFVGEGSLRYFSAGNLLPSLLQREKQKPLNRYSLNFLPQITQT